MAIGHSSQPSGMLFLFLLTLQLFRAIAVPIWPFRSKGHVEKDTCTEFKPTISNSIRLVGEMDSAGYEAIGWWEMNVDNTEKALESTKQRIAVPLAALLGGEALNSKGREEVKGMGAENPSPH